MKRFFLLFICLISGCAGTGYVYKHISPANPLRLCVLGNTGNDSKAQKDVSELLMKEECNSIHFLGDLVYPDGIKDADDPGFREKFYRAYQNLTETGKRPRLYLVLGNHDHQGSVDAWKELDKRHRNIIFPGPSYLVKMNDLCLVHLDTNTYRHFSKFTAGLSQNKWLQEMERTELPLCKKKIAFAYHPYKGGGSLKKFYDNYIIGKFNMLVSGHDHKLSDEGEKKGTRLLISGVGSESDHGEAPGFLVIIWDKNTSTLSYEFRKLSAE